MYDSHIHTEFSPDGKMTVGEAAERAAACGLSYIAITDHADFIVDRFGRKWDIENAGFYKKAIDDAGKKYTGLFIARGIEFGYAPEFMPLIKERVAQVEPDFIIGSAHIINGSDPYYPEHFADKDKESAYREYLIYLQNLAIDMKGLCDVLGHFDYIARYAPYDDARLDYESFPELVDHALDALITSGIGIEVNTSGYRKSGRPMPAESILTRYRQRGGEIITIGSDAHEAQHIAYGIKDAAQLLLSCGFRYQTIFRQRCPEFVKL